MNESILLEALKEIEKAKKQPLDLGEVWYDRLTDVVATAREAIKKWEDSSGKETGMNIFSDAIDKIKVITETYSHLGTMKRDILHEVGRLESVPPYKEEVDKERAFDKISRNIKPENKEIVDKEVAAINKSKEEAGEGGNAKS